MKILSKPFGVLATRLHSDDFFRARLKLTGLYLVILVVVMALLSGFLYIMVERQLDASAAVATESSINESAAQAIAEQIYPGEPVAGIELEIVAGRYVYEVEFANDELEHGVYVDRITGEVVVSETVFTDEFLNDFGETVLTANLIILIVAGGLSYLLAGRTLQPIKVRMEREQQFSQDVAHELRTPLAAIYATTQASLVEEESSAEYQTSLQAVQSETKRLIAVTENLLVQTRGMDVLKKEPVAIVDVLTTVVEKLMPYATNHGVQIATMERNKWFVIQGDTIALERLFYNLLHNAIKFSDAGQTVSMSTNGDGTVLVEDRGIGIPAADVGKVTERFYTTDTARREDGEHGTGLGLALVKEIAAAHNATLTVDSEVGVGTCVQVQFLQGSFS